MTRHYRVPCAYQSNLYKPFTSPVMELFDNVNDLVFDSSISEAYTR